MKIKRIIDNLLSSEVKRDNAPASSMTHFNQTLVELLSMCDYQTDDKEFMGIIEFAEMEIGLYENKNNENNISTRKEED